MRYDGLVFDLDGTLWDGSELSAEAINQGYREFGIDRLITREFVQSISGKPSAECDAILLEGIPASMQPSVMARIDQLELLTIEQSAAMKLFPGVREGVRTLSQHFQLCVVSNCGSRYLQVFLESSGIGEVFLDSECFGTTRRPKAENIAAVVRRQGFLRPCYIGDTMSDKAAADGSQTPFIQAQYGFGSRIPNVIGFNSFTELVEHLLSQEVSIV